MTNSTARDSAIVTEIGKYHLVAELARGGMGNVYLAVAQGPGGFSKLLVVKELKPELSADETYVSMFLDEARLAARLIHPNIVQTNEVGSDGQHHFMVMEFLDGRSLHRIGKRLGDRFPVGGHLQAIAEALLGLHHAHELREYDGAALEIVHRDVSPLNVFVTFAGQAKVLDFGIAKAVDSSLETKLGVLKGRVAYMAPEQAKGTKVDRRADVYSAGVMLWEAAAGRRLWPGMTEVEILSHLLRDGPPRLRTVKPDAPEDLDEICARAMATHREERYPSAADLLHDLEVHLASRDDYCDMRGVGALVSQAFADERRKMNSIIEETLTRVRGGPRSGVMPTLQPQIAGTPTSARIEGGSSSMRLMTPSGSLVSRAGASSIGSLSRSAPATTATLGSAQLQQEPVPASRNNVVMAAMLGGGVLATLIAVSIGMSMRGGKAANEPAAAGVPAVPAPTVAAHMSPEFIELTIRVSPPGAQIMVDGASVLTNPFEARYPKDGQIHHISAVADGYDTKLEDISFANDVSIDLSLNRHAGAQAHPSIVYATPSASSHSAKRVVGTPAAPPPAIAAAPEVAPPPPAPTPAPKPEVAPQGGRAPLRPIATNNPYGNP